MAGEIFRSKYGVNTSEFSCISDVNNFVTKKEGIHMPVKRINTNLFAAIGNIFKYKKLNPDELFDNTVKMARKSL